MLDTSVKRVQCWLRLIRQCSALHNKTEGNAVLDSVVLVKTEKIVCTVLEKTEKKTAPNRNIKNKTLQCW